MPMWATRTSPLSSFNMRYFPRRRIREQLATLDPADELLAGCRGGAPHGPR